MFVRRDSAVKLIDGLAGESPASPDALRSARPDPCGGQPATAVPTAINSNQRDRSLNNGLETTLAMDSNLRAAAESRALPQPNQN
jgi:hypothetical protein